MKLSYVERWILSNQFHILEALYPRQAVDYARAGEALENGYEAEYHWFSKNIVDDRDIMTTEESEEVTDILLMFVALKEAYGNLSDKNGVKESRLKFDGFSGNHESKQMRYARYLCASENTSFRILDRGDNFNSHAPILPRYRGMLSEWEKSADKDNLSKDDIIRITSLKTKA